MEHVIKQLKHIRADAVLGKKKHYNAADRKRNYYKFTSTGQIIINAITGVSLFAVVLGEGNRIAEILALLFSITATVLSGVQKVRDFENQAQGNARVADMYLEISKYTNLTLCLMADGILPEKEIIKRAEELLKKIDQVNKLGSQFPTNKRDFEMARKGIKEGEENYTEDDMGLWD